MGSKILLPGELLIIDKPLVVKAIVGSCVSVCLYNLITKAAGMNHFVLATGPAGEGGKDTGKYGFSATEHIVNSLLAHDKWVENYAAQVFGGAMLVEEGQPDGDIGRKNVEVARQVLRSHRIKIIREEVGGTRCREVCFDTADGTVKCEFTDKAE